MLSNWSYRYLTPFGKVTVIKSLGLSKLSHVALVIPNPTKAIIKRVESIFFKFIWGKGSEKVRREDCKLPVKSGGLDMPDLVHFWTAFKFSWLRRLLETEAFWPKILMQEISTILNINLLPCDLLKLGSAKLNEIAKKIKIPFGSKFWLLQCQYLKDPHFATQKSSQIHLYGTTHLLKEITS